MIVVSVYLESNNIEAKDPFCAACFVHTLSAPVYSKL